MTEQPKPKKQPKGSILFKPFTAFGLLGATLGSAYGGAYYLTNDSKKTALYGSAAIAGLGVLGLVYANTRIFHRKANGLGSCDTIETVVHDAFGKNKQNALKGKIALVTGANSGIGLDTVLALAKYGATVVAPCRSKAKVEETRDYVGKRAGEDAKKRVIGLELDLTDLESVKKCAQDFHALNLGKLDILILNAGIMAIPKREPTKQGFESQIGVNHLAQFLLTSFLVEDLKASGQARIVVVSSAAANRPPNIDFLDDAHLESKSYDPWIAYGNSKLSNVLFARELDERLKASNIRAFSLHPGIIKTNLGNRAEYPATLKIMFRIFGPFVAKNVPQGAATSVYCAVHPGALKDAGKYFADCNADEILHDEWVQDSSVRKKLWDKSVQLTGAQFP